RRLARREAARRRRTDRGCLTLAGIFALGAHDARLGRRRTGGAHVPRCARTRLATLFARQRLRHHRRAHRPATPARLSPPHLSHHRRRFARRVARLRGKFFDEIRRRNNPCATSRTDTNTLAVYSSFDYISACAPDVTARSFTTPARMKEFPRKMVRRIIVGLLRLALRVFFRRIEIAGVERVPEHGAVIFVVNHPNGLVDPIFILCHAPRRVSFLAKEPILRMPVIGWLARSLDALPVYRQQDTGSDPARNRETFARCRALLKRGGTIAICPEGVSHNAPSLRPLKTGTARIALGVVGEDPTLDLKIVPCGLYYTAKSVFRSAALLYFGAPLKVEPVALEADGEPARAAVRALSDRIEHALREVTLNAEHEQALSTVTRAEKIFSAESAEDEDAETSLTRELDLRRRFVAAYAFYFQHAPARLAALEARISRYEEELREAGVDLEDLSAARVPASQVVRYLIMRVVPTLLLAPLALVGVIIHYPAYKLSQLIGLKLAQDQEDVFATFKIAAALLFF